MDPSPQRPSLGASEGDRRSRPPRKPTCPSSEAGYTFAGVTSDPHATSTPARPRTDADRVADDYFDAAVRLSPIMATNAGIPGHEEDLDDVSPAGRAAFSALRRQTLATLADVEPIDDVDRVTISALRNRLELDEEIHAAGLDEMSLNVIASPLQDLRDVFDLMPQDSEATGRRSPPG